MVNEGEAGASPRSPGGKTTATGLFETSYVFEGKTTHCSDSNSGSERQKARDEDRIDRQTDSHIEDTRGNRAGQNRSAYQQSGYANDQTPEASEDGKGEKVNDTQLHDVVDVNCNCSQHNGDDAA